MFNDKFSSRHSGFTLIEVMIALFIFMVIMLGLAKGEIAALMTQNGNQYRDEALRFAEDEINRLKALQFSILGTSPDLAVTDWTPLPNVTVNIRGGKTTFTRRLRITNVPSMVTNLLRVDVAVGWNLGSNATLLAPTNTNHQTTLSTILVQAD